VWTKKKKEGQARMKAKVIQIAWHDKEPVYSVDAHSSGLIATGGADCEVKIWRLSVDGAGVPVVVYVCGMARHTRAVNCVRWSPNEALLASASDDGFVFIWRREDGSEAGWTVDRSLRAPAGDVVDVSWSADSRFLVCGTLESTVFVSSVLSGRQLAILRDHSHFVQGVAWDPCGRYVVTQSSDQTARIYRTAAKGSTKLCLRAVLKDLRSDPTTRQPVLKKRKEEKEADDGDGGSESEGESGDEKAVRRKLFLHESVPAFFRRPGWSPDGSILGVPAGVWQAGPDAPLENTAYLIARAHPRTPVAHVPGHAKPVVVVRFNPILYSSRMPRPRMIFAVASLDTVTIYATDAENAIAVAAGLHCAQITDLAWTKDGTALLISSHDGYCSVMTFD
jgi:chromatin assembly factor 1 subunit B